MSKMAAFEAGRCQTRSGTTGQKTHVPISAFLEDNGFVPSRSGVSSRGGRKGGNEQSSTDSDPSNTHQGNDDPFTPISFASAPDVDMNGVGNAFSRANGLPSFDLSGREGSAPANGSGPDNHLLNTPAHRHQSLNGFAPQTSSDFETKLNVTAPPAPLSNVTPEPMHLSIEGPDAPTDDDSLNMLRMEVGHLRTMCQNVMHSNNNLRALDISNVKAELGIGQNRLSELDRRVGQLEGAMHALQNTSIITVVERVSQLEGLVEDLQAKVGSGADAEVAKMREVMGCLKAALERVGGFL